MAVRKSSLCILVALLAVAFAATGADAANKYAGEFLTHGVGARALGMGSAFVAVANDASGKATDIALAWALGIGGARSGIIETSFAEETETDLFGEQVVLCGGLTSLVTTAFETLVEAGYQPEVAYFECLHEVKLIADLMFEGGMAKMFDSISNTAEYGAYVSGPRVITEETRETMREILAEIQDGEFARDWILENKAGQSSFKAIRRRYADHLIEDVGSELRPMFSWLQE